MNNILEKTFEKISEGASKEIIKALEQVIQDFNNNLTEQFGENFKALNSSVIKMVEWQENYKNSISQMESALNSSIESISNTENSLENISNRNDEVISVYNKLKDTIQMYESQTNILNQHLETYAQLANQAKDMFPNIESSVQEITEVFNNEKELISNTLQEYNQKTLETLTKQSDTVVEISQTLPKELATFETSLESLTKSFLDNYQTFLKNAQSLIDER
jgi:predicted  nucleic acid-binding Zn-ribbon protein